MIIDASAVVALLAGEPGCEDVVACLIKDQERWITPMSAVEAVMALARKYANPAELLKQYLHEEGIQLLATDRTQTDWAQHAFLTYGKGRHPARLNLGDCFSYAAAKALDAPLLYVGDDFAKTDLRSA